MPRYAYDRLTALDNSFLVLERPNAYMHVASTMTFEAGPLMRPDGGIDADRIRAMIGASLHEIPRYRQRLAWIPFENHAVWIDDENFQIEYHVRHTSLPRPGSEEQLKRLSARVMQQHLDRDRPLWEMWVVEGLEKDRFALISKVHHCMVDGVSGVDLMKVLMNQSPSVTEPAESPRFMPRPAPSGIELLRHEMDAPRRDTLLGTARSQPLRDRGAGHAPGDPGAAAHRRRDARRDAALGVVDAAQSQDRSAPPLRLDDDAARRREGGAQGLRRFAERRRADRRHAAPCGASSTGAACARRVSTSASWRRSRCASTDESGALGNRVSAWVVPLPVGEDDPREQLKAIAAHTAHLKESKSAVGAEVLTGALEWTPSQLLALGARNATRLLPFNMVVTNVPGPQIPMYMVGARMLEMYPHVPLIDNLGLGIALLSYDGSIYWGFNADYDVVPDLDEFVAGTRDALAEVVRAARRRAKQG